ncbi:TonB-dependent receptor [Acidovorax sp. CCYZU-2555]|uniref:TonB-dependent siderophore receptor n=1 Tax=Acidovorax sp. CCYZU-2555 TaxID=2835042 RepID=UPI001BCADAF6|nr:TonB-dependent receptor [Acidovorax sp. CCYZU-2555]MBS7781112.1 TonB-dependent siderophore receptor [Acidovorax sp. CCYZU-2555]
MKTRQLRGAFAGAALQRNIRAWQPAATAVAAALAMMASPAQAQQALAFDIPAQSLAGALRAFSQQAKHQVLFDQQVVAGRSAPAVQGRQTPRQALDRLLAGTDVQVIDSEPGAFTLRAVPREPSASAEHALAVVSVSGKAPGSTTEGTGSYTTFSTSSSTRLNLTPQETPQPITVITRQRIEDQGLSSLSEALDATAGITVKPFRVGADAPQWWARGASITNFQIDGIPSSASMSNYIQSSVIYDRVEVVKGATGMMSGLGTPAATINMIRKRPTKEAQASVTAEAGSWSRYGAGLDLSRALNEDASVRGRLVADVKRQGAWTSNYAQDTEVLYGIGEVDLGPRTQLTAGFSHLARKTDSQIGPAIILYSNGLPTGAGLAAGATPDWSYYNHQHDSAFAALEHTLDSGWVTKAELTHARYKYDSFMASLGGSVNPTTGLGASALMPRWASNANQTSLDAYVTGPFSLLGRRHELIGGITLSRIDQDSPGYSSIRQDIVNAFDWGGELPRPNHVQTGETRSQEYQHGAYLSSRLELSDSVNLLLGARVTSWKRDRDELTYARNAVTSTQDREKNVVIPYAGIVYALNDTYSLYASYTEIFRPQDSGTLMYTDGGKMDPEEGRSYEAGLKAAFNDGALTSSLALFRTQQSNLAVWNPVLYSYTAEKDATTEGLEIELSGQLARGWQLSAGYNYSETRDQSGARILPRIPRNTVKLFTSYRLPGDWNHLTLGGGIHWETKTGDPLATYTQNSYSLVNLMARYEVSKQLSVSAHLNNALDKRYYVALGGNTGSYGPPRNFMVSMKYRF